MQKLTKKKDLPLVFYNLNVTDMSKIDSNSIKLSRPFFVKKYNSFINTPPTFHKSISKIL